MGRKPRIEYPGGIYHVIQRGNNREFLFDDNAGKEMLLDLLADYREKLGFDLFGYVIMGNHYHLIIRQTETSLQTIMHRVLSLFGRRYNILNSRSGHVFEYRYKAIPVMDDKYLMSLLRYVHRNPVAANICTRVSDYAWSSDHIYRKNKKDNKLVDINYILDIIAKNRSAALRAYVDFMDDKSRDDIAAFEEVDFIGEEELLLIDDYVTADRKPLNDLLRAVTREDSLYQLIKAGSRSRQLTPYKKDFIRAAYSCGYTMEEIGKCMSISDVAVFYLMRGES